MFHGTEDQDGFYLVQEPYAGESLLARLNRRERFTVPQGLTLLDQVGRAVAFAQEQGLVHQSLNPLNILLAGDRVKVANFACLPAPEEQVGVLELRAYTAPEVVRGEEVTPQANVFSLGVLGFRLTAGSLPYPLTFDEPFPYRLETPPADLEEIPIPLQNFLLGCLAPEPEDRYADILTCLTALEQARELWRAAPREKRFLWQPKSGVSIRESATTTVKKLWKGSTTQAGKLAEKLKPVAVSAGEKIRTAPPRLFWGLGLGLLTAVLIWAGAQALKRGAFPSRSTIATKTPPTSAPGIPPKTAVQKPTGTRLPVATTPGPFVSTKPGPGAAPHMGAILPPPATAEKYVVLVASYTQLKHALALRNRLKSHNITAKALKTSPGGKTIYQVRVGPVTGKKAADDVARLIKKHEGIAPKVVEVSSGPPTPPTQLRRRQ